MGVIVQPDEGSGGRKAPGPRDLSAPAREGGLARTRADAAEWCRGRSWIWRAPLLLYLAYVGIRHLGDPSYGSLFAGITFGIHELGHLILSGAGRFLAIAGGSLAQIAAPAAAGLLLLRQRDYFGVTVAGAWLAFSLYNLATYIGDARLQDLPLLGFTEDPVHDWNALLSMLGILSWDSALAFLTRATAFVIWGASLAFGLWLCWRMAAEKRAATR